MQLYSVNTGYFKLDGGAMFGVVPKVIWNKLNPADENNLCSWALRSLLIEDGNRLILVDNGMGDKQDAKFFGHYHMHGNDTLDGSLSRHGFHRNDITDVILTHLHFDHCGGSIVRQGESLVPAFPNATYWSNSRHWEWATKPNDREKASFLRENILPIHESGQLRMIDIPASGHAQFTDSIQIRFVHGHTDGQMLPQIRYKGRTLVFMADLLPSVHHIPVPYVMAYDMFPLTSLHEKKAFVEEALAGNYILFFQHDPLNECCILHQTDRGIRQQECFALESLS
jgi:glyoxylase-like metal-dependent hydrolase (beta-lactamase superfamily II)